MLTVRDRTEEMKSCIAQFLVLFVKNKRFWPRARIINVRNWYWRQFKCCSYRIYLQNGKAFTLVFTWYRFCYRSVWLHEYKTTRIFTRRGHNGQVKWLTQALSLKAVSRPGLLNQCVIVIELYYWSNRVSANCKGIFGPTLSTEVTHYIRSRSMPRH